ncbi:hypothetical protein KBD08_01450 [Candidatus Babeliales bacterium]|nr:hypothetical protein [Candidatus Babeliales bacterium]
MIHQTQIRRSTYPVIIWILASILLHLIIMLITMTYKYSMMDIPLAPQKLTKQDQAILWNPTQPQAQQPLPQSQPAQQPKKLEALQPKKQEEEKKVEEKQSPPFSKIPIITPGKKGLDHQSLDGEMSAIQNQISQDNNKDKKILRDNQALQPKALKPQKQTQQQEKKEQEDVSPHGTRLISPPQHENYESEEQTEPDDNLDPYDYLPAPKSKVPVKTVSFKDLGLGFNEKATNFGNSSNWSMHGNSPDIPVGDELKYVTYLSQMARMLENSMLANSSKKLIRKGPFETLCFYVEVDRQGNLIDTHMNVPSKEPMINHFILDSVRKVGLFNPLPSFVQNKTFRFNWLIDTKFIYFYIM